MLITVDTRGKTCPIPVLETKKALEAMRETGTVQVLSDNEIAVQNILKLAAHKGLTAVCEETAANDAASCRSIRIQVDTLPASDAHSLPASGSQIQTSLPTPPLPFSCETALHPHSPIRPGMVVVIASSQMGNGDETLGRTLMKAFLFSLSRQDILPETMIFYHSGAFLTCEDSENLPDLRFLSEQGVAIMTCGTCLDFYGLKEKLAVGTVSNMYEIVQKQTEAALLIRP